MTKKTTVTMVLFEGFELLDVYGPLELFGLLGEVNGPVDLVMAGAEPGSVRSAQGPRSVADLALADVSATDFLLIPGGRGVRKRVEDDAFLAEVRRLAGKAQGVGSICTGAAILARAGLLDGRRATTNKLAFPWVVSQGPAVNWIPQARWVEDGCFFTAAGVSAGMDMSLAVISKWFGDGIAERVAQMAEYAWHREAGWDPFAKSAGLID
jgi:transcriptional regulator GlxA family with amidase domain